MEYRKFGKLDWKVSALGFGAMRLPVIERNPAKIDEDMAIRMMRYAWDHGVNYVDTAYGYHSGNSEIVVGKALKDGYRDKVKVATKIPTYMVQSADDFDRFLDEQRKKLSVDKIDFYLFHGLDRTRWPLVQRLNLFSKAEKAIADGRIGGMGFSFHDDYETFKAIIDGYDNWVLAQVQYNYMDINTQATMAGVKHAAAKNGPAVVVMEPIRGGRLSRPPEPVKKLLEAAPEKWSAVEWALHWVWNQPEVAMALSGMTAMEHVLENVDVANRSGIGKLTAEQWAFYEKIREAYKSSNPIPCTYCRYCMPCAYGVEIPRVFEIYNEAAMYNDVGMARFQYRGPRGLKEDQRADQCTECKTCIDLCPQKIDIPAWMKKAHEMLGPAPTPPPAPPPSNK
jgi:predicted aldo/keto reductase-like oxidoreductase